jgi:hypothetical protein
VTTEVHVLSPLKGLNNRNTSKFHSGRIKSGLKSRSACYRSAQRFVFQLAIKKYKDQETEL